jgi:hypothetical protein
MHEADDVAGAEEQHNATKRHQTSQIEFDMEFPPTERSEEFVHGKDHNKEGN